MQRALNYTTYLEVEHHWVRARVEQNSRHAYVGFNSAKNIKILNARGCGGSFTAVIVLRDKLSTFAIMVVSRCSFRSSSSSEVRRRFQQGHVGASTAWANTHIQPRSVFLPSTILSRCVNSMVLDTAHNFMTVSPIPDSGDRHCGSVYSVAGVLQSRRPGQR